MAPHYCVRLFFYLLFVVVSAELKATHTNEWAVEIDADRPTADHIARRHGFINMGKITGLDNIYHFERREIPRRMARSAHYHTSRLVTDLKVKWAEQQIIKKRVRRQNQFVMPQDRYWSTQWYLNSRVSTRGTSSHHNVEPVWKQGINGTGVVVSILDDGIQRTHPDIIANYDPKASYDYNSFDSDPYPRATRNDENNHGTRCAGLVATAKNRLCVVGVAFNAKIGGVRMLDGDVTDNIEARSLSHNRNHIDIYSCSWGPDDDGKTVDGPGRLTRDVLAVGARSGRNGLGSIYVWASGNGGQRQDDCGCDGYTNSIYTISVSSVTARQEQPWYLESCASTLISTYSSGYPNRNMKFIYNFRKLKSQKETSKLPTKACKRTSNEIRYLEHVELRISLKAKRRGTISIQLRSPRGTISTLLDFRRHDSSRRSYENWTFMTTHCWGENPRGTWKLIIRSEKSKPDATLTGWTLIMHGTKLPIMET